MDYMYENPDMWRDIEKVLNDLEVDGMSSDETDAENDRGQGPPVKRLRRVARGWLAPEISLLWRTVERYDAVRKHKQVAKAGNKPLIRYHDAHHTNHARKPVTSLPQNYYDPLWWRSLTEIEQEMIGPLPERALPATVSYVDWFFL